MLTSTQKRLAEANRGVNLDCALSWRAASLLRVADYRGLERMIADLNPLLRGWAGSSCGYSCSVNCHSRSGCEDFAIGFAAYALSQVREQRRV
jgi:hypothetical protein